MTKDEILLSLKALEKGQEALAGGQVDLKLQFTNHLAHHREDRIKSEDRFRRWIWISIPTIATLFIALVSVAYYVGKN